ncbi:MAG TPA: signal peptidase II [Candidatus Omnitrophota bacterium]|nr:signal peptidase II [Candidatus Omnitrophota bacterium]
MIFFYGLVGFVVLTDQFSKFLALRYLSLQTSISVIPQVLDLTLLMNPGVAFGLFSGYTPILFGVITISLAFLFLFVNRSHHDSSLLARWGLSLILGGAIGNWIDRLRFDAVIDFIDFRIWPVFNLADSAISIGVCLYILSMLKPERTNIPHSDEHSENICFPTEKEK